MKRLEELKLDHYGWLLQTAIFAMLAFGRLFGGKYPKSNLHYGN